MTRCAPCVSPTERATSRPCHYHPDSVAVFLTDHLVQMTSPDGSTSEMKVAAGESMFAPAGQHLPKNISGKPMELILVELK